MKRILFSVLSVLLLLSCSKADDYYVCAYVWPSCHNDPLAQKYIWPQGIGEWEVINQGDVRFEGHYQPRRPLMGCELDNDPAVVEKWINLALDHGVNTFIYDWYWFRAPDGYSGPYLESALNDGFLKAPSNEKMNFYIMYANHFVKYNYWNYHIHGDNTDILFDPSINMDEWKQIVERVIRQYFHRRHPLPSRILLSPVFRWMMIHYKVHQDLSVPPSRASFFFPSLYLISIFTPPLSR